MQGEVSHSSGFEVGQVVAGSYRVRGVLGSGGMGDVLDATQLALNRPVAIKVMKSPATSHPTSVRRFLREARITASLGSGTAASIYDAGRLESGEPYIVMERLLGRDLGALLEECGWLPPRHAAWLLLRAVEALAPAHRAGMVHRDIKPENLFLVRDSRIGELTVKVIDFGVARIIGDEEADSDDRGAMLGTPHYMAPEQIRSSREADARSDIWSLGVTAYELLTGELPFDGQRDAQLITNILLHEPTCPRLLNHWVPSGLAKVVLRCLEKDRADRYGSLDELAADLAPYAGADRRYLSRNVVHVSSATGHHAVRCATEVSSSRRCTTSVAPTRVALSTPSPGPAPGSPETCPRRPGASRSTTMISPSWTLH